MISHSKTTSNTQTVPFIDLELQYANLREEIQSSLDPIFKSAGFILGPEVQRFEKAFAEFCGAQHCVTLSSGTAALQLALLALGIGPGDEVITVPNTFIATAEAISFVGATPRFVDVDPQSFTMNVRQLEAAIGPRTRTILPVHLYGQPADMTEILSIAKRHKLRVIEDACQAHGATYAGKAVGTFGDVGCFSFYPGKNLGAAGDGGAIVCNQETVAETIRKLRDHGSAKKYHHDIIGHNFRLDTIQAAVLNVKLPRLERWNASRRKLAAHYTDVLKNIAGVLPPLEQPDRQSVFHLYVIRVPNREKVQQALSKANIQTGIHYPKPIHLQNAYGFMGLPAGSFPVSEELAAQVLSLPMYPELTYDQQSRVIGALIEVLGSNTAVSDEKPEHVAAASK